MTRFPKVTSYKRVFLFAFALYFFAGSSNASADESEFLRDGRAGFVVSHIEYALSKDAKDTGACPNGMTQGAKPPVAGDAKSVERYFAETVNQNICGNPKAAGPDANFRTVSGANVLVYGIDLDGKDSRIKDKPIAGGCSHDDFVGFNGERGIDNQFFRVVGCSNSFQSTGQSNSFEVEMYTGSWGILITLNGVDDILNDREVEIGIYSNADPIELSPTRVALQNATYSIDPDPRFQSKTRGRIVNGVLTSDPVDVRFHSVVNSIYLERTLHDARMSMTLNKAGEMEGYLAGYTPVEELYDFQYGFRNGKNAKGEPASAKLISGSSNGQARVLGHTCNGAYYALYEFADGQRDAQTGKCSSISTQYHIKAIPAFVTGTAN
jgi:hypothetical protein